MNSGSFSYEWYTDLTWQKYLSSISFKSSTLALLSQSQCAEYNFEFWKRGNSLSNAYSWQSPFTTSIDCGTAINLAAAEFSQWRILSVVLRKEFRFCCCAKPFFPSRAQWWSGIVDRSEDSESENLSQRNHLIALPPQIASSLFVSYYLHHRFIVRLKCDNVCFLSYKTLHFQKYYATEILILKYFSNWDQGKYFCSYKLGKHNRLSSYDGLKLPRLLGRKREEKNSQRDTAYTERKYFSHQCWDIWKPWKEKPVSN